MYKIYIFLRANIYNAKSINHFPTFFNSYFLSVVKYKFVEFLLNKITLLNRIRK